MKVDQPLHVAGKFSVSRDQPDLPVSKEVRPCLPLDDEILRKDYNIAPPYGLEPRVAIAVDITTVQGASPRNLVLTPDKFYRSEIYDGETSGRLIRRNTGQTTINPR